MDLESFKLRERKKAKQKAKLLVEFIKLMESAYSLHGSKNVDDIPISDITKNAFVSDMLFYNYFEKKENAILALVSLWFHEAQYILSKKEEKNADERWEIFVDYHLKTQANSPNFTAGVFTTLMKNSGVISSMHPSPLETYYFFSEFQFFSNSYEELTEIEDLPPLTPDEFFDDLLSQFLNEHKVKPKYSHRELVLWLTGQFWGVSTFSSYINNFDVLKKMYINVLKDMFLKK